MTSWTPFQLFSPLEDYPLYTAAIKDMQGRYIAGKDYGQPCQMSNPYMSDQLLEEMEALPGKLLPVLSTKAHMKEQDIQTIMGQLGRLHAGADPRQQRIEKARCRVHNLAQIEAQVMSKVRQLEAAEMKSKEAWNSIITQGPINSSGWWFGPTSNHYPAGNHFNQCVRRVMRIEDHIASQEGTSAAIADGFMKVDALADKVEAQGARLTELQDRILAVGVVAAHTALFKDRIVALEAENQELKARLATLESIILGTTKA